MAFILDDRVRETSTAPGTGSFTMNGAVQGAQTFASALTTNGDTTYYAATNGTAWETGLLTRTSATVYARTTIYASSNADAAVNFSTGLVDVFIDLPASRAVGKLIGVTAFAASGTWTRPATCRSVVVEVRGGGGGGGGVGTASPAYKTGAGGGEGGYAIKRVTTPGATETVTIGAGGAGGANTGGTGGTGGTTSFGAHVSATGGTGGAGSNADGTNCFPGLGGAGASGSRNETGACGIPAFASSSVGMFFQASGGGHGGGRPSYGGAAGTNGVNGGGGSGALSINASNFAGGVGGDGWCIVKEYE